MGGGGGSKGWRAVLVASLVGATPAAALPDGSTAAAQDAAAASASAASPAATEATDAAAAGDAADASDTTAAVATAAPTDAVAAHVPADTAVAVADTSGSTQEPPRVTGDAPPATEAPTAAGAAAAKVGKKKKQKDGGDPTESSPGTGEEVAPAPESPKLRLAGRVFARARADERDAYARDLDMRSARLTAKATYSQVDAEVSADLADKKPLKDAFVRLTDGSRRFRLYGGQFKAPFMQRQLESAWDLPLTARGFVADYLVDTHGLGGRRLGLMAEVKLKQAWGFSAAAGVFQGAEDELGNRPRKNEDSSARVAFRPLPKLTLGASAYMTSSFHRAERHGAAGMDAAWKRGRLRLEAEALAGKLPVGRFTAQTALAAVSFPLADGHVWTLEPVLGVEALQLNGPTRRQGHAVQCGLNVLHGDHFKAMLQGERALKPGDAVPALAFTLQLATRFY